MFTHSIVTPKGLPLHDFSIVKATAPLFVYMMLSALAVTSAIAAGRLHRRVVTVLATVEAGVEGVEVPAV